MLVFGRLSHVVILDSVYLLELVLDYLFESLKSDFAQLLEVFLAIRELGTAIDVIGLRRQVVMSCQNLVAPITVDALFESLEFFLLRLLVVVMDRGRRSDLGIVCRVKLVLACVRAEVVARSDRVLEVRTGDEVVWV